jgi:hypothetical protein
MRTPTVAQANALAAVRRREFVAVWVENADGTLVDFTALDGRNWFRSATIDAEDIDTPIAQATLKFARDDGATRSLSPTRSDSTLNRDGVGAFVPALDVGRRVKINVAVLDPAVSTSPGVGDWITLFDGLIDTVSPDGAKNEIVVTARDFGALLADAWLSREAALIVEGGTTMSLEACLQALLNAGLGGAGVVTLYTPVATGITVTRFGYKREPLMDAVTRLVEAFGWSCRYRWDAGTGSFRLTLYQVDRAKTTPDDTLGPNRYMAINKLAFTRLPVRNSVLVYFSNVATGLRDQVLREDAASQLKYSGGRARPIIIEEASDSPINTAFEAGAMADALLADLKDPRADRQVTMPLYWPVEGGDLLRFLANSVTEDSDQDAAVVSVQHALDADKLCTTSLALRGSPAGAYRSWIARARKSNSAEEDVTLSDLRETDGDTTSVISFTRGLDVAEVWGASAVIDLPLADSDWDTVVGTLAPLAGDSITVTRPADQQATLVQLVPYREDGTAGTVVRRVLYGVPQPPTAEYDDAEDGTTGTQWLRLTERGIPVASVTAQTQDETSAFSAFAAPTRGPGDASVVKGGTLGALEYEQDVPLSSIKGRQTFIRFQWFLGNGKTVTSPDFAFDADRVPTLIDMRVSGTKITAVGDSDTQSLRVARSDGAWIVTMDGQFGTVDVAQADPDGTAGLAAGEGNTFGVYAWNVPAQFQIGDPVPGRAFDLRSTRVTNGAVTGDGSGGEPITIAAWRSVSASAPPPDGSTDIGITLQANAAPAGWTTKDYISEDGSAPTTDETANLSPALSTPPTSATAYSWTSSYASVPPDGTNTLRVTVRVKAVLIDGSGVVQDAREVQVTFYRSRVLGP